MSKLLSVVIPCYNSEDYMEHCIKTLLVGGDEVEIIIVDDGSKDQTAEIADRYAAEYPTIVRAIHQENGGHGEALNTGIKNATGTYFKVVDSDDWVDSKVFLDVLNVLRNLSAPVDMFIANYVYDKVGKKHKKVISYGTALPKNRVFIWQNIGVFLTGEYILMHSVIYRTEVLRKSGLVLPKHTFYVDNLYVYVPLPYVKTMYYMDANLYHYYIGRNDQSVNQTVMIRRIDQQLKVNRLMIDAYHLEEIPERKLRNYMRRYLSIITTISSTLCVVSRSEENIAKKDALWEYLEQADPETYKKIKHGYMGYTVSGSSPARQKIIRAGYIAAQKLFGFN